MSRTARYAVFGVGAAALGVMLVLAFLGLPRLGSTFHPYRDHAVQAAISHHTSNVVAAVNFDQRGLDTLGEESILLASVLAVAALLRPARDETERGPLDRGRVLEATRLMGYVFLPVTLVIGFDVIAHGHLTPGGGFQGGVVVGTGIHLLYVAGSYRALERVRPTSVFEWGEALGAGAFACVGIAGTLASGAFLSDLLPLGTIGQLLSAGTVPVLNGAVGIEVASGVAVLLASFLEQAIKVKPRGQSAEGRG